MPRNRKGHSMKPETFKKYHQTEIKCRKWIQRRISNFKQANKSNIIKPHSYWNCTKLKNHPLKNELPYQIELGVLKLEQNPMIFRHLYSKVHDLPSNSNNHTFHFLNTIYQSQNTLIYHNLLSVPNNIITIYTQMHINQQTNQLPYQ